ncbi:ATP synthase epsilon chain [Candidatus Westeberhardia cardiocondylae]|uniref:ATP synthase epsilon chain n=1 Tax=Candidatus Westeberhardia cardiocondylae TaxID=1594731 RepID=A0A0H5BWE0_9ENTR|nr:ATP synthase F1 subunit epsilon [Candidatus Westeberhardia cardiocondylae]CEN31982.1 ATP synthase epsilon chain [Candidatus Westeberhardia cardiocondylae]
MRTFFLNIISLEKRIYFGFVQKIQVTGFYGNLEIFPRHVSFLTLVKSGKVFFVQKNGDKKYIYLTGGILEVYNDVVTILSEVSI